MRAPASESHYGRIKRGRCISSWCLTRGCDFPDADLCLGASRLHYKLVRWPSQAVAHYQ